MSDSGISVQQANLEGTQGFAVTVKEGGKELAVFLPDDHARQIADYILFRTVPINFLRETEKPEKEDN